MEFKGTKETLMVSGGTEIVSMPSQIKVAKVGGLTYQEAVANATLFEHSYEMLKAMQEFCDRVERGEVRSKKTYDKFKDLINRATTI